MWAIIALMALTTFLLRISVITLFERIGMPLWIRRALPFIGPAVMTALVLPQILTRNGALFISASNARLFAGVVAFVVAWRTNNIVLTLTIGMLTLWAAQYASAWLR